VMVVFICICDLVMWYRSI